MIRLHFVVEGQTEETFVNRVLAAHLAGLNVVCDARKVLTSRRGHISFKGGLLKYAHLRNDLLRWLREDRRTDARFTSLVDLYGLPEDFPGLAEAGQIARPEDRVARLESAFAEDIGDRRFVPHIQLHEFESLLLCDVEKIGEEYRLQEVEVRRLVRAVQDAGGPEEVDDGAETAPSKRIVQVVPRYGAEKARVGPLIAERVGLVRLRAACPHFAGWLARLEALGGEIAD